MPRIKPTTIITPRVKPTTTIQINRSKIDYLLQESLGRLLLENWEWALLLESAINTSFNSERYFPYLQTSDWEYITDSSWVILEWKGVNMLHILETNWR